MAARILYVLHNYFNRAGTEEHVKLLARELSAEYEIGIVFPRQGQLHFLTSVSQDVTSFPADKISWPQTEYNGEVTQASLKQIMVGFSPDLVHIQHFIHWPLRVIEWLLAYGKPTLLSLHDYYLLTPEFTMQFAESPAETVSAEYSVRLFNQDLSDYLAQRREYFQDILETIGTIIVPSEFLANEAKKVFAINPIVVEHGIDCFSVSKQGRSAPYSDSAGVHFGFIGSLLPQKGWHTLIRPFSDLLESHPRCTLTFYGGTRPARMPELPNIYFAGVYDQADLPIITAQIDVGVIGSLFKETYCLTLSELWMAGLPVMGSNIGALGNRICEGVNGRLFTPGDAESILSTMRWFVENDAWKSWQVARPHTAPKMVDHYRKIYSELL